MSGLFRQAYYNPILSYRGLGHKAGESAQALAISSDS
jgi:hypothetical protein